MAYQKKIWVNGVDKANETNMNHIEDGIEENSNQIETLSDEVGNLGAGVPIGCGFDFFRNSSTRKLYVCRWKCYFKRNLCRPF